jgi:hypothetical protein
MLESVIDSVKKEDLYFTTVYSLGSIYQFYEEKEMAFKTFAKALMKFKDVKSLKYYMLTMKLALMSAYAEDMEQAAEFIKMPKYPDSKLPAVLKNIIKYCSGKPDDNALDTILEELYKFDQRTEFDLVFETELVLLKALLNKRKFIKCRELNEFMSKQSVNVEDYNLALEYQKLSKNVARNSAKVKKNIPNIRKVSPSVKKRVRNRRSN